MKGTDLSKAERFWNTKLELEEALFRLDNINEAVTALTVDGHYDQIEVDMDVATEDEQAAAREIARNVLQRQIYKVNNELTLLGVDASEPAYVPEGGDGHELEEAA